jgi:ATP-dependent Lhr-like helicase
LPVASSSLSAFHPALAKWFAASFGEPTDVQTEAWKAILSGSHTLIAAPTGSGKTLAALLPCIQQIVTQAGPSGTANGYGSAKAGVKIIYITPLKALNNDIHYHIIRFVEAIDRTASEPGLAWPGLRAAVRTGDTTASQRASMLKRPPEVLITTPESLFLLLTSEKGRAMLRTAESVIVDEIHDLAPDKRGSHLSLSLERLSALCGKPVQRIGVSATQKPLERIARFLGGWEQHAQVGVDSAAKPDPIQGQPAEADGLPVHPLGFHPRPVKIVESAMRKTIELLVTMPDAGQPIKTRESVWFPIMDRILQAIEGTRSVLIFVNSRRLCERLCLRLNDYVGYEMARAHHGSMSRERRLEVESLLKAGELRALVATSSLELGIDVGHVDLVIQIDSPLEAAAGIQRIGRAGHAVGDASRGVILARHRGMLPEIAVLSRLIAAREIEEIRVPRNALDVLSQQIVAMTATDDWLLPEMHKLIAGSDSYRSFPLSRLTATLQVLSGFYPFARPLLTWDRDTGKLTRRANTSMAAITGAGTIPQSSAYPVHHAESRVHLGELDEEFIHESRVGDVFQLGTSSWMIQDIQKDRIYVSEAKNRFSEIPFWRNEAGGRSYELGEKLGLFLEELSNRLRDRLSEEADGDLPVAEWLGQAYYMDPASAGQLITLVRAQMAASEVPTNKRLVIEHYRDMMNQTHVILHNHWGRRINRTWLLAIERQFEAFLPYRLYGNAKDNGIEFVLPEWDASWLQAVWQVTPDNAERLLLEALPGSPMLAIAFRRIAETSLLLSRSFTRTPMWQKRLRSEELLRESLPFAGEFPYLHEAMRESLYDYLDLDNLKRCLSRIASGDIDIVIRESDQPSPFAAQFISDYVNMQIYEGDGLDDSIQLQLMNVSKELAGELFGQASIGRAVNPEVAAGERERLERLERMPRNADELFLLLKRRGDLATGEIAKLAGETAVEWIADLRRSKQIAARLFGDRERWFCRDEEELYAQFPKTAASIALVAGRYAEHVISFTEADLLDRYPSLSEQDAKGVVDELLRQDRIEQAPFAQSREERIWTSRKIAKRIIRLSIQQARKQAEPVEPIRWCAQMAGLQHVLSGTQLRGSDGLLHVIGKLQGFFMPLSLWESVILPSRLTDYRKEELDLLCASGEVLWIGKKEPGEKEGKIAFFLAPSKALYAPYLERRTEPETRHPELLTRLKEQGASFLTRLSRESGKLPSEVLSELMELVWEGHVSNDQFAPLRLFADSKGKGLGKIGSGQGRWYALGSLGETAADAEIPCTNAPAAEESAVKWTHHLLESCGIITKELVGTLTPFRWDELLPVLRRLEEWGVVTRGLFIRDVQTMQFTTREIADTIRSSQPDSSPMPTLLSAVDPANPFGLVMDWPADRGISFARKNGNYLVLQGGQWIYWIENNGKRIYARNEPQSREPVDPAVFKALLKSILRQQRLTKIKIEQWNGEETLNTEAENMLRALGAERDHNAMVFWPSQLN